VGNKDTDYDESDVNMLELLAEDIWKIIERKRADDALRESEERYRALFEESPEPIIIFSIDGFVLNVNPAYETHTGYTRDETVGINLTDLPILDEKNMPDYINIYSEIMKTHLLHRMELPVIHRNGTYLYVEIFISPLMKNERIAGFQIIARDISARKKLEQNLQWELSINAALAHLSETIIRPEITVEDMGTEVLDHAKRLTGSDHGYVGVIDQRTRSLVCSTLTAMMGKECALPGRAAAGHLPGEQRGRIQRPLGVLPQHPEAILYQQSPGASLVKGCAPGSRGPCKFSFSAGRGRGHSPRPDIPRQRAARLFRP
jgi:PAS domain S-box-containing protein